MNTLKIFLASSAELQRDREQFEIFIGRKNKLWAKKNVFLHLEIWEDFVDAMSQTRLQDEYNKAIRECDIFVMLFCTKVGKFTAEEFGTAFGQFKATNKPLILTYFKNIDISLGSANKKDLQSLWAFQKKLKQLGHFQTEYKNSEGLREHFAGQLDKLADEGFIKFAPPAGPLGLQFEQTLPADARLDLLLTALAELPGPCLLVLDNANEPDDLEANYLNLRRCPNFHVLLTTRITEFGQADSYRIDSLPAAEALQLFRTHYPGHKAHEDALFQQIRLAVSGNTLVIELLAKNLRLLNRLKTGYTLPDLLADLQQKGVLALAHSQAVSTVSSHRRFA